MRKQVAILTLLISLVAPFAPAQIASYVPDGMEGVGIDQLLDAQAALDTRFKDERDNAVTLRDYCDGKLPVLLTFNFSDCPMICSGQLEGLVGALRDIDLMPGKDFHIVTVSLDPDETTARARATKKKYLGDLGRPGAERGWHFLTGEASQIRALADSVGYRYKYVNPQVKFSHQAALILLTPNGHVARYIAGLIYQPTTVKFSLIEASEGGIGSITDGFFLSCFQYDAASGQYTLFARNFMKFGAVLTVLALGLFVYRMRRFESKLHGSGIGAEVVR